MLLGDPRNRSNLLVLVISWSVSSYTYYFVEFYMKLVPFQNIYGLMILIGVSDFFGCIAFYFITNAYIHKQRLINQTSFVLMSVFSFLLFISLLINGPDAKYDFYAVLIFGIRFFSNITFNMSYL
jgi:hypothetical protein